MSPTPCRSTAGRTVTITCTQPRVDGERAARLGYKHRGVACFVFHDPQPGTVPLYRFFDPRRRQHFYTLHPYAEFIK